MPTPAQSIQDLGNGRGLIYITKDDGTLGHPAPGALNNDTRGLDQVREWMKNGSPIGGETRSYVIFEITTVPSPGSVTTMTIDEGGGPFSIISGAVAVVVGDALATAQAIAADINGFVSAPNYTAVAEGDAATARVYAIKAITGPATGTSNVVVSGAGNTITGTDLGGGQSATVPRYRVYLDALYSASPQTDVLDPAAVEVTWWIMRQGKESAAQVQEVTITGTTATVERRSSEQWIVIKSGALVNPDLKAINMPGVQYGDTLYVSGYDPANSWVAKSFVGVGDNLRLIDGLDFAADGTRDITWLVWTNDPVIGDNWNEVSRTSSIAPNSSTNRQAGIPSPTDYTVPTYNVPAGGGTFTLRPGTTGSPGPTETFANAVRAGGTVTLTSNMTFTVNTANAINGDTGFIEGTGSAITVGANNLFVGGLIVPAELALSGNWRAIWSYNGAVVAYHLTTGYDSAHTGFVTNSQIKDATIDLSTKAVDLSLVNAKVADNNIDGGAKLLDASVTEAKLDAALVGKINASGMLLAKVTIPSAQVLTLFSAPVTAITSVNPGAFIKIIDVTAAINGVTIAYTTNTTLEIYTDSATESQVRDTDILLSTVSRNANSPRVDTVASTTNFQYLIGQDIKVRTATGDPLAGDGDLTLWIWYREFS